MECGKIREKFSSLLEGDLDPSEEKVLKEHLASCRACQKDFGTFKKTMNWLHSVGEVETPEGFLTEIYQKMEDRRGTGYGKEWIHRLRRLKLPAQAVAMVAVLFTVLYLTKMMPMETYRAKNVDVAKTAPSEAKTDTHLVQEEVKTKKQEVALLSKETRAKEVEQQKTSLSEGKDVEKVDISPPSQSGEIRERVTAERSVSLAVKPSQEIILRVADQEKAILQLQGLVKQFGGEIVKEEENVLLASLPTHSYAEFKKGLEGMVSLQKAEPASPQQVAPGALKMGSESKEEESAGKKKEKEMGRPMADQIGRIAVRILLVEE
jgi:hypothetical protein